MWISAMLIGIVVVDTVDTRVEVTTIDVSRETMIAVSSATRKTRGERVARLK